MIDFLIPLLYTCIGIYFFYKSTHWHTHGLGKIFPAALFVTKVLLSVLYTLMHYRYYGGADTANYYDDSLIIYATWQENPLKYLMLTFGPNNLSPVPKWILQEVDAMGYWFDSGSYAVVRFYAVSNLLSGGNIYVAGIFMSFITTIALMRLYPLAREVATSEILAQVLVFAIPSVLFWSSGVHKEGLLLTALCFMFYAIFAIAERRQVYVSNILILLLSAWMIWYIRDPLFYLLMPGAVAYFFTVFFFKKNQGWFFVGVYVVFLLIGLHIPYSLKNDSLGLLEALSRKQEEFRHLQKGYTDVPLVPLHPDLIQVAKQIPASLIRALSVALYFRPVKIAHWLFLIENIGLLLLLAYLLYRAIRHDCHFSSMGWWWLWFTITAFILVGLIVPNGGTIIRYRSILWPFLFLAIASAVRKG